MPTVQLHPVQQYNTAILPARRVHTNATEKKKSPRGHRRRTAASVVRTQPAVQRLGGRARERS